MTSPTVSTSRIAVIGCGYWGKNLVRNFAELGALGAVCDPAPAGRELAASIAPGIAVVEDPESLLQSDSVAAVAIATPAETHFELGSRALMAGKDTFIEKPLALTCEQGAELVRLAEEHHRILMVGHVLEYHPGVEKLFDLVNQGALGKVRYVYSHRLSLGKVRREENILWSFAPHDIAVILRLLGAMPFEVVACGGCYLQPNIADVTVTHLLFDNGVRAHIHVSWLHPFKEQRLVVIGSSKMASFDDVSKKLIVYDERVELSNGEPIPVKGDGVEIPFPLDEPLQRECQAFLDAIATRNPPVTDGRSGVRVLSILNAAQRSLVTHGQPVALPPQSFELPS